MHLMALLLSCLELQLLPMVYSISTLTLLYSSYEHEVKTCSQHAELPDPSVGSTKHTH